jgi:CheY-like chemotaxis protein
LSELFIWLEQNFVQAALDKGLRFRLYFSMNRSLIVCTDIVLLQSVLMNLISNAIKFTVRGGILVSARQRGDKVLLQVWDTGMGISEPDLLHIFDEFYQVANPQRSREAGLGLGLSICQRTMSLLGGEVTCRSRVGRGSVFELSLPLNVKPREIAPLPIKSISNQTVSDAFLYGKRLVVLEDDALVADGMINLLEGLGAKVQYFHNAEDALQYDELNSTDYFIVDYALGTGLNGIQFLNAVQQKQQIPLRAIVVTGETSSEFIGNTMESPWTVLHKPITYAKLVYGLHAS